MNNYATDISSYSDLTANTSALNNSLVSTESEEIEQYAISIDKRLKKGYGYTAKAFCIIGIATAGTMLIDIHAAPSQVDLYAPAYKFQEQSSLNAEFPHGYEIINGNEIINYFIKYPYLKNFLHSNLSKFQSITGSESFSLEYDGMKEEDWENLYVIVHLENKDDEYIDNIEEALFNEWLNDVPASITNNLTISFA